MAAEGVPVVLRSDADVRLLVGLTDRSARKVASPPEGLFTTTLLRELVENPSVAWETLAPSVNQRLAEAGCAQFASIEASTVFDADSVFSLDGPSFGRDSVRRKALLISSAALFAVQPVDPVNAMVDLQHMRSYLTVCGFCERCTRALIHGRSFKQEPTPRNVRLALDWLVRDATAGDSLVVYFEGRGGNNPAIGTEEEDRLLKRRDAMLLPAEMLAAALYRLQRGVRLTIVMDLAHSSLHFRLANEVRAAPLDADIPASAPVDAADEPTEDAPVWSVP